MNSLLIKFYNNYFIIQIKYSPKLFYIKYYNIIHGKVWGSAKYAKIFFFSSATLEIRRN